MECVSVHSPITEFSREKEKKAKTKKNLQAVTDVELMMDEPSSM
jgi:hypothetical protein